jgi:CBS domain-containing protein
VADDAAELRTIQVKVRGSARADGRLEQRLVVFCPETKSSRTIDECARCTNFESLTLDPRDRSSFLTFHGGEPARLDSIPSERWSLATPSTSLPAVSIPEPAARTPVSEVMTKNPITVSPEMSLEGLTLLFLERGLSGAPVVDASGECVGVVSKTDLVRHIHERGATTEEPVVLCSEVHRVELELGAGFHVERILSATVEDVMTPVTFSVPPTSPIAQAAALMVYEGIHRLPVLDDEGVVVGIVSSLDLLRWISQRAGYLSRAAAAE